MNKQIAHDILIDLIDQLQTTVIADGSILTDAGMDDFIAKLKIANSLLAEL